MAPRPIKRLLVALDAGRSSDRALSEAVSVARALGAMIWLVHVGYEPAVMCAESALADALRGPGLLAKGKDVLSLAARSVPVALLGGQLLLEGDPADEILGAAEQVDADLIVLGTHGRGPVSRFLLGSTAHSVLLRASCPVLTVGDSRSRTGKAAKEGAAATRKSSLSRLKD